MPPPRAAIPKADVFPLVFQCNLTPELTKLSWCSGIVKELLARWPELCRICDSTSTSALYVAASAEHFETVKAILDVDPSCVRIVRKNGKTSVHNRARFGSHQIVKALIERDPGVVSIADKKCQTALHMAVKGKDLDIVEELLSADPSILNARDKKGNTALHVATRKWRPEIVRLLLSYRSIEVNALNNERKTAMDLADESPYEHALETREILIEAGAQHASNVLRGDAASDELRKEVSDLKQDLDSQHKQNLKTNRKVYDIAKELKKLHREAVQNTINSVTVVAVLIASIAFTAIFNLPGQYDSNGRANIAEEVGFRAFCLLNAMALFISLAVVVVQITLVAWETKAQERIVKVVNKLMWAACVCICGAFLSIAFVDVGQVAPWMAITVAAFGGPMIFGTLALMGYLVFRQWFRSQDDSQRAIRRSRKSRSFSWSRNSGYSDPEVEPSDHDKSFYAL
ncbi:ankyrin repeat family protein isoform X2 [Wolffia australiana]